MRVAFIQSEVREYISYMLLSANLKKAGHEVEVFIFNQEPIIEKMYFYKIKDFDIIGFSSTTISFDSDLEYAKELKKSFPNKFIIFGGAHPTYNPEETIKHDCVDAICIGEGLEAIVELADNITKTDIKNLWFKDRNNFTEWTVEEGNFFINEIYNTVLVKKEYNIIKNPIRPISNINDWPRPDYDLYYKKYPILANKSTKGVYIVRGCPYKCLAGDTEINTIYGLMKIRDIEKNYKTIPVLTRDKETHNILFSDAININKYGENEQLVRVVFDDNTHIDCTPDHKFMTFKNGNQFIDIEEKEVEAQYLVYNQRVRAVKYEKSGKYKSVRWTRRERKYLHRLVAEYKYKKELTNDDKVHHIDRNKLNNHPDNIEMLTHEQHWDKHRKEQSERMKGDNNPVHKMSKEHLISLGKMQKGKKRSLESRKRYRDSKLREKNPNYKHGQCVDYRSRLPKDDGDENHKVKEVIWLDKKEDVYCMEVPNYDWFFANNVLVHNCAFCYNPSFNDMYKGCKIFQCMDIDKAISEIEWLKDNYGFKYLQFISDNMTINKKWLKKFLKTYRENIIIGVNNNGDLMSLRNDGYVKKYNPINRPFLMNCRANEITKDIVSDLKYSGCNRVDFGVEHGNDFIRNDILKRNMSKEQIIQCGNWFKEAGIRVQTTNIFGLPYENFNKAWESVELNRQFTPEISKACILQPFENTGVYNYAKENNLLKDDLKYSGTTIQIGVKDNRSDESKIKIDNEKQVIRLSYLFDFFVKCRLIPKWLAFIICSLPLNYKGYYKKLFDKQNNKYK